MSARPAWSRRARHAFSTCQNPKMVRNCRANALLSYLEPSGEGHPQRSQGMTVLMRSLSAAVLTAGWCWAVPIANAQNTQREAPSPSLPTPAPNITDQKLDAAAAALESVAGLQKTYRQRLADAPQTD